MLIQKSVIRRRKKKKKKHFTRVRTSTSCLFASTRSGTPSRASLLIIFSGEGKHQQEILIDTENKSLQNYVKLSIRVSNKH